MEPIISYGSVASGSSSLLADEVRIVTTFTSGLVRVDQSYTCATADAAAARQTLAIGNPMPDGNSAPALDGLFIYPAPQERASGSTTEFLVSAYGRTKTELTMDAPEVTTTRGFADKIYYSTYIITGSLVIRRGESLNYEDLGLDAKYEAPFGFTPVNPSHTITSVRPALYTNTTRINWDGTVSTIQLTYLQSTLNTGITEINDYIAYSTPSIGIEDKRAFGEFIELEIIVTITAAAAELGGVIGG
jgi:hypothetical protein